MNLQEWRRKKKRLYVMQETCSKMNACATNLFKPTNVRQTSITRSKSHSLSSRFPNSSDTSAQTCQSRKINLELKIRTTDKNLKNHMLKRANLTFLTVSMKNCNQSKKRIVTLNKNQLNLLEQ